MRISLRGFRIFALAAAAAGILLAVPVVVRPQAIRASPIAVTAPRLERGVGGIRPNAIALARDGGTSGNARDVRGPQVLGELDRYASWGGAIGAGLGFVYGVAVEPAGYKPVGVIADTVFGFAAGITGGAVVYLTKLALSRR